MSSTATQLKNLYKKSKKRKILALSSLFLILLIAMLVSISVGAGTPTFMDAVKVIQVQN